MNIREEKEQDQVIWIHKDNLKWMSKEKFPAKSPGLLAHVPQQQLLELEKKLEKAKEALRILSKYDRLKHLMVLTAREALEDMEK